MSVSGDGHLPEILLSLWAFCLFQLSERDWKKNISCNYFKSFFRHHWLVQGRKKTWGKALMMVSIQNRYAGRCRVSQTGHIKFGFFCLFRPSTFKCLRLKKTKHSFKLLESFELEAPPPFFFHPIFFWVFSNHPAGDQNLPLKRTLDIYTAPSPWWKWKATPLWCLQLAASRRWRSARYVAQ